MVLDSPIWTIKEVAEYMRVGESHVRNAIKGRVADTPRLPAIKMGRRIRILRDELYGWLLETQGSDAFHKLERQSRLNHPTV